jgi:hypothetical protein
MRGKKMIITFIAFLSLAGLMGLCMLVFSARQPKPPRITLFAHGFVSVTGMVLLLVYSFGENRESLASISLFALAAMGGLVMLMRDLAGKFTPRWLAFLHGTVAISGFVFIIYKMFY